jgi:hypothetical protein
MRIRTVYRYTYNIGSGFLKLGDFLVEGNDFCGAHESKVQRIEEQNQVFALAFLSINC